MDSGQFVAAAGHLGLYWMLLNIAPPAKERVSADGCGRQGAGTRATKIRLSDVSGRFSLFRDTCQANFVNGRERV